MNAGDLMAKLEANKKPLAAVGVAGVAGLALLQRRKAGGDVGVAAGAAPAGAASSSGLASPNGQVVYSSEASDVYNALQGPLATVSNGVSQLLADRSKAAAANTIPVAARLTSPTLSGQYVQYSNGGIYEVESDGSLFWLSASDHAKAFAGSGGDWKASGLVNQLNTAAPENTYGTAKNLAALNAAATTT